MLSVFFSFFAFLAMTNLQQREFEHRDVLWRPALIRSVVRKLFSFIVLSNMPPVSLRGGVKLKLWNWTFSTEFKLPLFVNC